MLILEDTKPPIYTICGIDPGTNNLGISIIKINTHNLDIISIKTTNIKPNLDKNIPYERIDKILSQKTQLLYFIQCNYPNIVCSESPYYNHLSPGAYAPLVEMLYNIRYSVLEYNRDIKFITYDPSTIKISIGSSFGGNKDEVKTNILNIKEIVNNCIIDINKLDNNAIDSIAVAYTHLLKLRKHCL